MKRREYLNEYHLDDSGKKYVYGGAYYALTATEKEAKTVYAKAWALSAVLLGAVVGSGCINAAGMSNTFYVIMPYMAEVALLFSLLWNTVRLLLQGAKVKAYIYQATVPKLPSLSMALAIAAIISFVASLVFIILNGFEQQAVKCILYLFFKLFICVSAVTAARFYRAWQWSETTNESFLGESR